MNETEEEMEALLAACSKACDLQDSFAVGAQGLYIEAGCVTWLAELLGEYTKSQTFSFEAPAPDDTARYRELTAGYGFLFTGAESIEMAAPEGRRPIRPDTEWVKRPED